MNRQQDQLGKRSWCVPHARGDEPHLPDQADVLIAVFPTPVGMNRAG